MAHYEDIEIDQGTSAKWQILCLGPDGEVRDLSNYRASTLVSMRHRRVN